MLEEYLIKYCSPTLRGLKVSNLVNVPEKELISLKSLSHTLLEYGIRISILKTGGKKALLFVYREKYLREIFEDTEKSKFLKKCGYKTFENLISHLRHRLESNDFPHEIGIFLGYPLEDVRGYIINKGQNYKLAGYWKVYFDEAGSKKIFDSFTGCRYSVGRLYRQGVSLKYLCTN